MDILQYNELDYSKVRRQFEKVVYMLKNDDFHSADVKKLTNTGYYRAKLDYTNRLLFKFVKYNNKNHVLLLEVIHNHEYDKSRFLAGASVNESKIKTIKDIHDGESEPIIYLNNKLTTFHILDKIISFDDTQQEIFNCNLPLIVIGSAGSGKTVLTLEKMKHSVGDILYVTHSPYLAESSRNLYYGNQYTNDEQNIDFLSYKELIETIKVPRGHEIDGKIFAKWLSKHYNNKLSKDGNKLYEEFKGVLTGSIINKKYLSFNNYIDLGVKQSIFPIAERAHVYSLFEKYLEFLNSGEVYDSNMISHEYLSYCQQKYDYIVVDEIQDLTNIQLYLILQMLRNKNQFILSGDSNQIVHPNFFSWSKIKTMFYHEQVANEKREIKRILNKNYRNSLEIYKFYINALYVAVTRAINTLYIVEDCRKHNLLELIGLKSSQSTIDGLGYNESSVTEWRQEAHKLEQQGKQDQAEEIKKSILDQKQTPWESINKERLETLKMLALTKNGNKKDRLMLFEYAVIYQQEYIIEELRNLGFKPAQNPHKARDIIDKKYFLFYTSQNISIVQKNLDAYGVDFRNIFNQTSIMTASLLGNVFLVKYLIENGADIALVDNAGKNALQIALLQAYTKSKYAQTKVAHIYKLLVPSSTSVQVDGKLIKIDNHSMEFFLLNLMIAVSSRRVFNDFMPGFATADFIEQFKCFPNNILLDRRKRRNYISSILSKNETHRVGPYNRKLFLRVIRGRYIINPELEAKVCDSWTKIYTLLDMDDMNIMNFVEKSYGDDV